MTARTIFRDGLNRPEQELVEVGHVQQVETEEVAVEDGSQNGRNEQQLRQKHNVITCT